MKKVHFSLLIFLLILNSNCFAQDQNDKKAFPCRYGEEYKPLDFWLGEWDVYVNDKKTGTSSITKSEGGCTLYEDYKTFKGFLGRSTNYYDPVDKKYTQIWIDKFNNITIFKEVEAKKNYLQMSVKNKEGKITRMTYTKNSTGNVTQIMEDSKDQGKSWVVTFTGIYKKKN